MKKIVLFDPSYGTSNMGDFIINEAIMNHMGYLFLKNYLVRYSTHNPLMHFHQLIRRNYISRNCHPEHLKFLGGSNIFKHNLLTLSLDWNINILTKGLYRNSVALGAGSQGDWRTTNIYTKSIYKYVLSKNHLHSVRDESTKDFLETLGLKAINTGCPTMWSLTPEHCLQIPISKSDKVVFTLTPEPKDSVSDQTLIDTLNRNYDEVYFWVQGTDDLRYFNTLDNIDSIKVVGPHLELFNEVLNSGNIDYVGTRLHGGIYAMQHRVRSIIIIVDNRARDMQKSYNINAIEREDIDQLETMINSEFATDVRIDEQKIKQWKEQFVDY